MNLKQLPYLIAIASSGSLSAAARELSVSQPALSKYLAELERQVGMDLFFRHKKRLYPTPAGRIYIETAKEIQRMKEQTIASIQLLDSHDIAELHIGISPHRGAAFLAQAYPDFIHQFPQIRLIPHEGYSLELQELTLRGKVQYSITSYTSQYASQLQFSTLFREEVVLAVPEFHRQAQRLLLDSPGQPFVDLADFRDSSFVMPSAPSALLEAVQPLLKQADFEPLISFSTPNVILTESLIRQGAGIGFLPSSYIRPESGIAYFHLNQPAYLRSVIITPSGHTLSAAERFFTFLHLQHSAPVPCYEIQWSQPLIELVREFDREHTIPIPKENLP